MVHYTRSLFVAVGLFCGDVAVAELSALQQKQHAESVCMASTLGFGPALTKAGLQIDESVARCGKAEQLACAVHVLDVVESCAWIAAYITAAAGRCTSDAGASCANGITSLVASIVAASQASTAVAFHCPKAGEKKQHGRNHFTNRRSHTEGVEHGEGKHHHHNGAHKEGDKEEFAEVNIGSCVVDSWEAAWALAKAGIMIDAAVIDCGVGAEPKCTLDALKVTASIVATAHFVLSAVNNCQVGFQQDLACASASMKVVAALTEIAAAAIEVEHECSHSATEYHSRRLANITEGRHSHHPLSDHERIHLAKYNMTEDDLASDPMRFIRLMKAKQSTSVVSHSMSDAVIV